MVLPTLPSYLELKKVNFRAELLRPKLTQNEIRENWQKTARQYHDLDFQAKMHNSLTSKISPNSSLNDSYTPRFSDDIKNETKEKRLESLKRRQQKLAQLLQTEQVRFEAELRRKRYQDKENEPQQYGLFNFPSNQKKPPREPKVSEELKLYAKWRRRNPEFL